MSDFDMKSKQTEHLYQIQALQCVYANKLHPQKGYNKGGTNDC